jgi:putative Holliday junction resolvase
MTEDYYRVLALDVGNKRIGVAVSDATRLIARPVETVTRKNREYDVRRVAEIIAEQEAAVVVIGLPKNMDDSEGEQATRTRAFAKHLSRVTSARIIFEDERLSTFSAIESLVERGVKTGHSRELVDMEAATIILQGYLDRERSR